MTAVEPTQVAWLHRTLAYLATGGTPSLPPLGPLGKAALVAVVLLAGWVW